MTLASLNKYFYKYRGRFFLGIVFVTISNIFAIVPAQLVRISLDIVRENLDIYRSLEGFLLQSKFYSLFTTSIFMFIFLILSMTLLKGLFMFFMRQTIIVMSRHIEYDQKNEIFDHYQKLNINFYNRQNTGDLMNRISEDVGRVRMYVGPAIMYTINLVVLFVLISFAMFRVNTMLAVYVLVPLPVLSLLIYYVHDIINKKSERVQAKLSDISTHVQESFSGIRVLKSFGREQYDTDQFEKHAHEYKDLSMSLVRTNALFYPILLVLIGFSIIITIFIGGNEVIQGNMTLGNIAEFVIYVNMLTWPVASLGWVVTLIQRAAASQKRINEFLHTKPEIISPVKDPLVIKGEIKFQNVTYTYPGKTRPALKNVSFIVNAGQSLAITGKTGSGKSSIASLLLRLADPDEGVILIDDKNLTEINLDDYRGQAGCVPQDVFLFSDTITNNILFGLNDGADNKNVHEKVIAAAKNAAVHDNIMEFPSAYETMVGERGITLSGGQKQRISMARAIIREPKILVFDDCLSAVDTKTEELILSNLRYIMLKRTTVIISHRISSVKNASEIIVMDDGGIAERGNHQSLLSKNGLYAELYHKQLIENRVSQ